MEYSVCLIYEGLDLSRISGLRRSLINSDDARPLAKFYNGTAMPPYSEEVYSCFGSPVQVRIPDVGAPSIQVTSDSPEKVRFIFRHLDELIGISESEKVDWEFLNPDCPVEEMLWGREQGL